MSHEVAATRKRTEKRELLAELIRDTKRSELGLVVAFLMGVVPHGKLGVATQR